VNADLAQRIADRATTVRGVARLSAGGLGAAATYVPGRRIDGVRVREGSIEVHIVAAGSAVSLPTVAAAVRDAVRPLAEGSRIDVFVDDLDLDVVDLDALGPELLALPDPSVWGLQL
jgi:signal transduction protein with GAF and PtsI domain